jgi:hypothetical protein
MTREPDDRHLPCCQRAETIERHRFAGTGWSLCAALALVTACGETGQNEIAFAASARSTGNVAFTASGWSVTLTSARVSFGPLYLCATASASSDLCPTAIAEYTDAATIDLVSTAPLDLGGMLGVTGTVHSGAFDYGVTWLATQTSPTPLQAAPGGHSAHFEGAATLGARTVRFVADIDALPLYRGTRTVQGARTTAEIKDGITLDLVFDPVAWWSAVDFDEIAALPGDPASIPQASRATASLLLQMTTNALPSFHWTQP